MLLNSPILPSHFRLDDPEIQKDPYRFYPVLREQAPVFESKFGEQPCWIVSRRADVSRVLMDPVTFSSRTTPIPVMVFVDPPEHGRLRKMVSGHFTQAAVQPYKEEIEQTAESLLAPLLTRNHCDIIGDFASPLTVSLIGLVLGIPVPDVEYLRELTRLQMEYVLAVRLGLEPSPQARVATEELVRFVAGLIKARRYEEGRVVDTLAELLSKGELSEMGCAQFVVLLLVAGHSTATNLIGSAVYTLAMRRLDLVRMRASVDAIPPFIEEVLRTRPPFHRIIRVTTQETVLGGVVIPPGAIIRLLLASANRDPAFYQDAEVFDPDQNRRTHLAFGQGIHSCLGNWLARLEAVTAFSVISRRTASLELHPSEEPVGVSGGTFNEFGFELLPVILRPI